MGTLPVRNTPAPEASSKVLPLIAFFLTIAALYFAREVLIPFALAVLFAFLLSPAVKGLERCHLGRGPSVGLVVMLALACVLGVGWVVSNQLIEVVSQLPDYRANIQEKLTTFQGPTGGALRKATDSVKELSEELSAGTPAVAVPVPAAKGPHHSDTPAPPKPLSVEVIGHPPTTLQSLSNMLGPLAAPLGTALIVVVFTIFILLKREDVRNRLIGLVARRQLYTITQLLDDAAMRVSRYLLMEFSINATFGTLIATGLYFIGVPYYMLWGVLAGLLRFIPYVGPLVGGSLPFLLSLVVFNGWTRPLMTLGFFLLVELITSNAIEPWLGSTRTGISSLAILVAAVFWGAIWGPAGLMLSMPLTVCLVVMGRYIPQLEFLFVLLGDEPVLSPKARLYQRLLALDQQEAQTVVESFLKEHTLLDMHDLLIIPALSMAEQDRHAGTLEESKAAYIVQSISEIIGEAADYEEDDGAGDHGVVKLRPDSPTPRVLCVPANDQADAITAAMLSQIAERHGYATICVPLMNSVSDEVTTMGGFLPQPGDIICICALPPFALLKARSLTKQLHAQFPDPKIIVGLWNFGETGTAAERFGKAFANHTVVTTLAEALVQIRKLSGTEPEETDGTPEDANVADRAKV